MDRFINHINKMYFFFVSENIMWAVTFMYPYILIIATQYASPANSDLFKRRSIFAFCRLDLAKLRLTSD